VIGSETTNNVRKLLLPVRAGGDLGLNPGTSILCNKTDVMSKGATTEVARTTNEYKNDRPAPHPMMTRSQAIRPSTLDLTFNTGSSTLPRDIKMNVPNRKEYTHQALSADSDRKEFSSKLNESTYITTVGNEEDEVQDKSHITGRRVNSNFPKSYMKAYDVTPACPGQPYALLEPNRKLKEFLPSDSYEDNHMATKVNSTSEVVTTPEYPREQGNTDGKPKSDGEQGGSLAGSPGKTTPVEHVTVAMPRRSKKVTFGDMQDPPGVRTRSSTKTDRQGNITPSEPIPRNFPETKEIEDQHESPAKSPEASTPSTIQGGRFGLPSKASTPARDTGIPQLPVLDISTIPKPMESASDSIDPEETETTMIEEMVRGMSILDSPQVGPDSNTEPMGCISEDRQVFRSTKANMTEDLHDGYKIQLLNHLIEYDSMRSVMLLEPVGEIKTALDDINRTQPPTGPTRWFEYDHGYHILSSFYEHDTPVDIIAVDDPDQSRLLTFKTIENLLQYRKAHICGHPRVAESCISVRPAVALSNTQKNCMPCENMEEWDDIAPCIFMDCVARFVSVNPKMMIALLRTSGTMMTLRGKSKKWQSGCCQLPSSFKDMTSRNIHGTILTIIRELYILQHSGRYTYPAI